MKKRKFRELHNGVRKKEKKVTQENNEKFEKLKKEVIEEKEDEENKVVFSAKGALKDLFSK